MIKWFTVRVIGDDRDTILREDLVRAVKPAVEKIVGQSRAHVQDARGSVIVYDDGSEIPVEESIEEISTLLLGTR